MSEQQHVRADGTVTFLPHRLNRHPVVVRGLTADELWICCGLSGAAGLLVGIGTRYGAGCTSGHGVCGVSRLSPRSMVATTVFVAAGFVTVWLLRHAFA